MTGEKYIMMSKEKKLTAKTVITRLSEAISVSDRMKILNWKWSGTPLDIKVGNTIKSIRIDIGSSTNRVHCDLGSWNGYSVPRDPLVNNIRAGNPELWDIQVVSIADKKKSFQFKLLRLDFKLEDK